MGANVSKSDLEMERLQAGGRRHTRYCDLIKAVIKYGCFAFCFWCLGDMIRDLAHGDPAAMAGLCDVLKTIRVPHIVYTLLTLILGSGFLVEKRRNRRLVEKRGDKRHKREQNDPVNSRSGLDRFGIADDE